MTANQAVKVYLAASFSRRKELFEYAYALQQAGLKVTSRWIEGERAGGNTPPYRLREFAEHNIEDLRASDVLIAFTEENRASSGARHVEFGVAIERGMPVIVIGPLENIFYHLVNIHKEFREWKPEVVLWATRLGERFREDAAAGVQ